MLSLAVAVALLAPGLFAAPGPAEGVRPASAQDCDDFPNAEIAVQPNSVFSSASVNLVVTSGATDGLAFSAEAVVVIDGFGALETTQIGPEVLNAQLPAGVPPGRYDVRIVNNDATCVVLDSGLRVIGPTDTPEPTDTPKPSGTPAPTSTPGPTEYVRPVIVVESYGASSAIILPGQNLDFEITLRNDGRVTATNIVATFVPGDFTPRVTGGVNAVGDLGPGGRARFFQPLTAGESLEGLTQGSLEVKVAYTDPNGEKYEETFTLTFAVQEVVEVTKTYTPTPSATPSLRPQLLISAYTIDAATLLPGTRFTLDLEIRNVGNAGAARVSMVFGGGSASSVSLATGVAGAGGEFENFAPLDSSNVQFLGDLDSGAQAAASQRMIVNAAAEPGAYAVKFSFLYSDDKGGNYTDEQVITLLVESRPLVDVGFYREAGVLLAGQPNLLPLQVVNLSRDTVVLGGLEVAAPNAEFSNNITLVGSLEAGGYFTLDATVIPQQAGPLDLTVTIDYTDDFNQAQVITQTLTVEVQEGAPAPVGPEGGGSFPGEAAPTGPETFGQMAWRFVLGMIGLDSGRPETGEVLPPPTFEQEQRAVPVP